MRFESSFWSQERDDEVVNRDVVKKLSGVLKGAKEGDSLKPGAESTNFIEPRTPKENDLVVTTQRVGGFMPESPPTSRWKALHGQPRTTATAWPSWKMLARPQLQKPTQQASNHSGS